MQPEKIFVKKAVYKEKMYCFLGHDILFDTKICRLFAITVKLRIDDFNNDQVKENNCGPSSSFPQRTCKNREKDLFKF
jgi:hypothetical protein